MSAVKVVEPLAQCGADLRAPRGVDLKLPIAEQGGKSKVGVEAQEELSAIAACRGDEAADALLASLVDREDDADECQVGEAIPDGLEGPRVWVAAYLLGGEFAQFDFVAIPDAARALLRKLDRDLPNPLSACPTWGQWLAGSRLAP